MSYKVLVTRILPGRALEILEKECDHLEVNREERPMTKEEIMKGIKEMDGILCLLTDRIDSEVMDSAPKLKIIANYAVGYDNIDVKAATERGIMVTNTPGVLTETTADLTWALIMAIARRIVEADRFTREGKFKGWSPTLFLGQDVYGKTIGIIGLGRIGFAVARRALGFDMRILYYDLSRVDERLEKAVKAQFVPLDELLSQSDYITIHVPLTQETRHLIGEREFGLMKPTAYLINAARGPIVDEAALYKALKERRIAGAALDVYEREPEIYPGLTELDNVVLVPHIGSASVETRSKMAEMAVNNLLAGLKGQVPPNLVNPEVLARG